MSDSWIHPALYPKPIGAKGRGVFSKEFIPKGTLIVIPAGGTIWTEKEMRELKSNWGDYFNQVSEDYHWGPSTNNDIDLFDRINHSCDPNVGWQGDMRIVTLKDVLPYQDELGWDYATSESWQGYEFNCLCETALCRGKITSSDWKKLELQIRYNGSFQSYLQKKIENGWRANHIWIKDGELFYQDNFETDAPHWHKVIGGAQGILFNEHSNFQHVQIFRTKYGPMLVLDGYPQITTLDGYIYTEALGVPALVGTFAKKLVVIVLGGGDGALLELILHNPRVVKVFLVDIDPVVPKATQIHMSELWNNAQNDERVEIVNGDALEFLKNFVRTGKKAHLVYSDLTDPTESALSTPLMCKDYFQLILECLLPDGLMTIQAGRRSEKFFKDHLNAWNLVTSVFPYAASFNFHVDSFSTVWSGIIASASQLPSFSNLNAMQSLFMDNSVWTQHLRFLNPQTFTKMFAKSPEFEKGLIKYRT